MSSTMCNMMDSVLLARGGMKELVRGHDVELLQQMMPLVREQNVSLDLRDVERIDAAGIAALISLYGCAHDTGHCFTVANASARVAGILALVGLDRILLSHNADGQSHSGNNLERSAA